MSQDTVVQPATVTGYSTPSTEDVGGLLMGRLNSLSDRVSACCKFTCAACGVDSARAAEPLEHWRTDVSWPLRCQVQTAVAC